MHECSILVMDEPSATLTDKELDVLFKIMHKLVDSGVTIIYISHRMEEIFNLADDITVLRDGKHIGTVPVHGMRQGTADHNDGGTNHQRRVPERRG